MPKVPSSNVVPLQAPGQPSGPPPSPTDFAMAAAMMHSEGHLFEDPTAESFKATIGNNPMVYQRAAAGIARRAQDTMSSGSPNVEKDRDFQDAFRKRFGDQKDR